MSHSIITILSDLGTRDVSVAAAKAVLVRHVGEDAVLVDMSHHVAAHDVPGGAYVLLSAYRYFAKGTVHILAVDVFAGDVPRMLLAAHEGYFFIAPDNGILQMAFGDEVREAQLCAVFEQPCTLNAWMEEAGHAAAAILQGRGTDHLAQTSLTDVQQVVSLRTGEGRIDCDIRHIDRYGNIALDVTRQQFEDMVGTRPFRIQVMRKTEVPMILPDGRQIMRPQVNIDEVTHISSNYNDAETGRALCRFNDADFLEVAINHGSVAANLITDTEPVASVMRQSFSIFF